MDKSREEFVVFLHQAMQDRKSAAFTELYQYLINGFVKADVNHNGKVDVEHFDTLVEFAATLPRRHGFAPKTADIFKTDADRKAARTKLFKQVDVNKHGFISLGDWIAYALGHIATKVTGLPKDHFGGKDVTKGEFAAFVKKAVVKGTTEHKELYCFLVNTFEMGDVNHTGTVSASSFDTMVEAAAHTPRKFGFAPLTSDLFPNDQDRFTHRKKLFEKIDTGKTGTISLHEWIDYATNHIFEKAATL